MKGSIEPINESKS